MRDDDECIHGLATGTCAFCARGSKGTSAIAPTKTRGGRPMELLLKWSPAYEDDTCERHRAAATIHGSTWWGCWSTADSRRIGRDRLALLEAQLADGVLTRAFVYRLGSEPEVWRAHIISLAEDESLTDRTHRPLGMEFDGCFLFVELADFEALPPRWPEERLGLWDQSDEGALLWAAIHNQTSPLYVFELP